ncbi:MULTISPECIES: polyphenol oxidase family protein [Pseudomonas]|uniref:polyphenol oxidase family protein n=1 Tax=Pseudomonas TaxID=286 RepID=UPI0009E6AC3E|nr:MULTISPECIES: polyphenol oxidase family protein [Pseudomonas]WHS51791.1 polyphenol oxidase family protein [Pseudomonas brassicacearum]
MTYHASLLLDIPGIDHGFETSGNLTLPEGTRYCTQAHGTVIIDADVVGRGERPVADALFSRGVRDAVAVITADCLPVLVASVDQPFVAAIHAGWQGLKAGILGHSLSRLEKEGAPLAGLRIAIGPSIGPCCYEVNRTFVERIEHADSHLWQNDSPPWTAHRVPPANTPWVEPEATHNEAWFDLRKYALYHLAGSGVSREQVQVLGHCTYCCGADLGSYRRRSHRAEPKTFQYSWIRRQGEQIR